MRHVMHAVAGLAPHRNEQAKLHQGARRWADANSAALIGLATLILIWVTWGAPVPSPRINDEVSYRLQADIFAQGHWSEPSPPLAEFFEQPHVLVTPVVASKYPPGNALVLALGSLVKFPPLVPLLLSAVTGTLLFKLVRRLIGPGVASLAWLVWITNPLVLAYQPSYLSEVTDGAALMIGWWCLVSWRETGGRAWLCCLALALSWGMITRPLSMLALGIVPGFVALREAFMLRRIRDLLLATLVCAAVLSILPMWSQLTTGNWKTTPMAVYNRKYLPVEQLGFTTDTTLPERHDMPPPMQALYDSNRLLHQMHAATSIRETITQRLLRLAATMVPGAHVSLLALAVLGIGGVTAAIGCAVASTLLLILAYVPHAGGGWAAYYLEITPVFATLVALGCWRVRQWLCCAMAPGAATATCVTFLAALGVPTIMDARAFHQRPFQDYFNDWINKLPADRAVVFVRYSSNAVSYHANLVRNSPDLAAARVWVVHDLGDRNRDLRLLAPDRVAFEFSAEDAAMGPGLPSPPAPLRE